ncbi:conserved Plasmodium protein, unknown function [Plasmodium gonderi]|uniref:MHD domain-containing protein n=1 Tax=Plasmodium gonderi TaxID=77519 RepID=A0A1Y1JKV4_PLAGO|nr:conserved Plasmodium protein, unknown function [Plasmodium gonderi]GAW81432.1 conserved Plasmodium protein, unknown function [Plasmodium gonderi]
MNGIRALFLFNSTCGGHNMIYEKRFLNVEMCAKSSQELHYVNMYTLQNVEELLKKQIINISQDAGSHEKFIELNKTISCYSLEVKNKIVYPFLLIKKGNFSLITLLLMENYNMENPMDVIRNNTNKLLYYNFMNDFLNYIKNNMKKWTTLLMTSNRKIKYDKLVFQKISTILDAYVTSIIPYGKVYGRNNSFLNYLKGDMYKTDDIIGSQFFHFYNFLLLIKKEISASASDPVFCVDKKSDVFIDDFRQACSELSECNHDELSDVDSESDQLSQGAKQSDENRDEQNDKHIDKHAEKHNDMHLTNGQTNHAHRNSNLDETNNSVEISQGALRKQIKRNDILYINKKPPFIYQKNGILMNKSIKETFFKLLIKFYATSKSNRIRDTVQFSQNGYYHLYLFFFYNYTTFFEKNKKIDIVNKFDEKENIKISKGNIQTYVPVYVHERNKRKPPQMLISEELTSFITSFENESAEIKGEIILRCDDERYLDVDMMIGLDNHICDIYAADFVQVEKRGKNLKIQLCTKYRSNKILTYYYKSVTCPLIGSYKLKKVNEKFAQIDITLQWNSKTNKIIFDKKITEYFFVRLPIRSEILEHNLKCNLGKLKIENGQELRWILPDFPREFLLSMSGMIELGDTEVATKQLVAEIHVFSKSLYSKTHVLHLSENIIPDHFLLSGKLTLVLSSS